MAQAEPLNEAENFHRDGYIILKGLLPADIIEEAYQAATTNFSKCLSYIADHNKEFGMHAKKGFVEIVQRNEKRYEMQYGMDDTPIFQSPLIMKNERLHSVLSAIFGDQTEDEDKLSWKLCSRSIVNACPGALEQQWHVDGAHVHVSHHRPCHVLNVFFPLVNLTMENGPTEVRPGSHYLSRDLARLTLLAKVKKTLRPPICPLVATGDALLFDYRTLHRGRANLSNESRPVLVLTYSKSWFRDLYNFPKRSIYDPTPPPPPPPLLTTSLSANKIPLVSVVIPSRGNKPLQLKNALRSVLSQEGKVDTGEVEGRFDLFQLTEEEFLAKKANLSHDELMNSIFFNIEIIVCIDGDEELKEEEGGGSSDPLNDRHVKVVRHLPSSGGRPGLVRNTGIAESRGDWVAFLDDDDVWMSHKLRHQLLAMRLSKCLMSSTCGVEDHVSRSLSNNSAAAHDESHIATIPTMPRQFSEYGDVLTSSDIEEGNMNPIICSSVLMHRCLISGRDLFGDAKYGQDILCWRQSLALRSASQAEGSVASFDNDWYGRLAFMKTCYVVYGTTGGRSSTNKETRQAINMIVDDHKVSVQSSSTSVTDLIQGFVGV